MENPQERNAGRPEQFPNADTTPVRVSMALIKGNAISKLL